VTTPPIHTTVQRFSDVANARGLEKTRLIRAQRTRFESPPRDGGGDFYAPALAALRRGLLAGDVEYHLATLLAQAPPGRREHYTQFAAGMFRLVDRYAVTGLVPAPRGPWRHGGLEVNVTGLLGVQLATGERQAWMLHKKVMPLDERAADIPLYVADALLAGRDAGLAARVVDVRRATVYEIHDDAERTQLRDLVSAEAEAYVSLWKSAA
jgi:hypothetical protein